MENLSNAFRKTQISSGQSMHVEKMEYNGSESRETYTCVGKQSDSIRMHSCLHGMNGASSHHLSSNKSTFLCPPQKDFVDTSMNSNHVQTPGLTNRRRTLSDTYTGHEVKKPWIIRERGYTSLVCSPRLTQRHIPRDPVQPQHGSLNHGVSG